MDGARYPQEEQTITAIIVAEGNVRVCTATTLLVKAHRIVIKIAKKDSEFQPDRGQMVTLLYDLGEERILRLKNVVTDVVDGQKWLLQPTAQVAEGERREFLRATAEAGIYAEVVNDRFELPSHAGDPSALPSQSVDLSGSGVSFDWEGRCKKDEMMFVELGLGEASVRALGRVVRAKAIKGSQSLRVAVHFTEVAEGERDVLINAVFRHYYEKMHFKPVDESNHNSDS